MARQFCLKWNNHTDVMKEFKNFLSIGIMVDVTLACDGQSIKAHKMVLSACSPFFRYLFLENPCKHPIVILKDIKYSELKAVIDFMYCGEVNIAEDQLTSLIRTAQTLRVTGLGEELSRCDRSSYETENESEDESSNQSTCTVDVTNEPLQRKPSESNESDTLEFEPEIKPAIVSDDLINTDSYSKTLSIPLIPCDSALLESQQHQQVEHTSTKSTVDENFHVSVTNLKAQSDAGSYLSLQQCQSTVQSNKEQNHNNISNSSSPVPDIITYESADVPLVDIQGPGASSISSFKRARKKTKREQNPPKKAPKKIGFEETQSLPTLRKSDENSNPVSSENEIKSSKGVSGVRKHKGSKSQEQFKCNECTYTTAFKSHLVRHLESVHQEKPYQCASCTYTTANLRYLKRHTECVHEGKKTYKCKKCSFAAPRKDYVTRHEKIHTKKK